MPVVGEILAHVVLTAVLLEELTEGLGNFTDLDSWLADFLLRVYEAKVTGKVLDQLNAEARSALADLDLDAQERLAGVCAQLDPGVSPSHPYDWFYRHLASECERVTSSAVVDPIVATTARARLTATGTGRRPAWAGTSRRQAAGEDAVAVEGMRVVEGPNFVQLVGATTNRSDAAIEPGAAAYGVLSGSFDSIPSW